MRAMQWLARVMAVLAAAPCAAHHSYQMFDNSQIVTLRGTVKEFQWTNPHSFIQLLVSDGASAVEWSIELEAPTGLYRAGWRPSTLRPGDKVTLVIHPLRDGTRGGAFASGVDGAGRRLTTYARRPQP